MSQPCSFVVSIDNAPEDVLHSPRAEGRGVAADVDGLRGVRVEELPRAGVKRCSGLHDDPLVSARDVPRMRRASSPRTLARSMRVYGVVSGDAVELFLRREDAEAMVDAWREDEPGDADLVRVEGDRARG